MRPVKQGGIGLFAKLFGSRRPTPGLGPELASGRIEGFTVTVLRTGQIVAERSGDCMMRICEQAVALDDATYAWSDIQRVAAAGGEFEVNNANGLFRVVIKYPKQVIGRIDEVLARAAKARGIRVGAPRGRDPFNL